ncbi:hypothetical protein [Streptomyces niveiscabiei]|uniref:hypothetical protein n=1 Tax=Streptomyces niveiscabiei TaxID=164115 RepID=UPI0038F7DB48
MHLLHPEAAVLDAMLSGWARQQLGGRGLQPGTIDGRRRVIAMFQQFTNEYSWHWTAAHIDEWMADLVMRHNRAKPTLRNYQGPSACSWSIASTRSTVRTRPRSSMTAIGASTSWTTREAKSVGR